MGCWFSNIYDLYAFVRSDPISANSKIRQVILAATGEDMEQDIKDACVAVSGHRDFKEAEKHCRVLWDLLEERIGVA